MPATPSGPRNRRTESELLRDIRTAVLDELGAVGFGRLTMEGIAKRSGTAKTSLYRRWGSPAEVVLDALGHDYPEEVVSPELDDLRGDLLGALRAMTGWLSRPTARAIASVLGERTRHPELARAVYERIFDAHGGRFTRTVLLRYAERGEIDPALVTPVVTDVGEAMVLKHALDSESLPGEDVLAAIVDQVILPAVGRGPAGGAIAEGRDRIG
ncbi:TetR/AcrR family transcriptional regulator [Saccharopolyspora sp. CA-218241]|uniref:TetR/AcrR family transcriptional regulator n=1 Tax=Saccharopolyspora sp. CA-218241 TaxID=3240027 RepID=UPI003D97BD22